MESSTATPGARLRAWRLAQDPKRTLTSCAEEVGVKHPTWIDWESGARSPSLEKALAIEILTDGDLSVEAWGFDGSMVVRAAGKRALRAADDMRPVGADPTASDFTGPVEVEHDERTSRPPAVA